MYFKIFKSDGNDCKPTQTASANYPVQVWELLMADQSFFIGELPSAQQTGHLFPVGQLVLLVITLHDLLRLTVAAVRRHQPHLQHSTAS